MLTWDCETLIASLPSSLQASDDSSRSLTKVTDACKAGGEPGTVDLESLSSATSLMSFETHDLAHGVSISRSDYTYDSVVNNMLADDSGGSTTTESYA
jgi:hypothetical protein